jgi:glycosyltransferase involved in cell wall biosynthesis
VVDVSVNIITRNRPFYLNRAINSVLKQKDCGFELVIIDTGNGINKNLVDKFNDNRIKYHVYTTQHLADARNYALNISQGEYVAVLDDDDEWITDDKLSKQLSIFKTRSNISLVGTQIYRLYPDGKEESIKHYPESNSEIIRSMLIENPFCHSATMFKRNLALEIGGYKPVKGLWNINEYELWLELGLRGAVLNLPDTMVTYTVWTNSMTLRHRIKLYIKDFRMAFEYRDKYPYFGRALWRYTIKYPIKKVIRNIGLA